jgi:hypothetical protein
VLHRPRRQDTSAADAAEETFTLDLPSILGSASPRKKRGVVDPRRRSSSSFSRWRSAQATRENDVGRVQAQMAGSFLLLVSGNAVFAVRVIQS